MQPLSQDASSAEAFGTRALRVVAMGGGTGLSTLLRGFKHFTASSTLPLPGCERPECLIADLTAVVTVTDDGGSSGRLRKDFKMLPPGDLRNCMVALSEDEQLLSQLFRHRFRSGGELEGHAFGNLFVAALQEMTGDFAQAIRLANQVLATRGQIYPATTSNVTLAARMDSGEIVRGETRITGSRDRIAQLTLEEPHADGASGDGFTGDSRDELRPARVPPLPETLAAIAEADVITLGPGSLFTSVITNLLVDGIPEALAQAKGLRVYVCNLMTQANESLDLTASQHIERILEHAPVESLGGGKRPFLDYALVNTAPVSQNLRERYAAEGAETIAADVERIEAMGIHCVTGAFAAEGDVLRHDADLVAKTVLRLALAERAKR
jgi:2-phospho-L-lactate transferase/gluconeogenesis factor (CofD/UPF0052 family)